LKIYKLPKSATYKSVVDSVFDKAETSLRKNKK